MNRPSIGANIKVDDIQGRVVGYVEYENIIDKMRWIEYRILSGAKEYWLSWDDAYEEYSISWSSALNNGMIDSKWHKVDSGRQKVIKYAGDVDVEYGELADFIEYEDATEEETLSLEIWEEGTEVSEGYYVDLEEIRILPSSKSQKKKSEPKVSFSTIVILAFFALFLLFGRGYWLKSTPEMSAYLKSNSPKYEYVTSVTGSEKQKADVYQYIGSPPKSETENTKTDGRTAIVAKDIVRGIEGNTVNVSENNLEAEDQSISILTEREYCLVYLSEEDNQTVLVQVSPRKYVYASDVSPYKASRLTNSWYRTHYYNSGYSKDASKWKSTPSSYQMYNGPILQDLGNGYFDAYSSNIKQESINSRQSSDGGVHHGK